MEVFKLYILVITSPVSSKQTEDSRASLNE